MFKQSQKLHNLSLLCQSFLKMSKKFLFISTKFSDLVLIFYETFSKMIDNFLFMLFIHYRRINLFNILCFIDIFYALNVYNIQI